jgi:protoporphyrinogen/coproporphyrinogen III oxidase
MSERTQSVEVDVVVVGGGISGLSAAFYIRQTRPETRVVVLESSDKVGGKIASAHIAGLTVDCGPDAFLARVPGAVELATELGLKDELIAPGTGKAWLWARKKLRAFPDGLVLGAPSKPLAVARSGILSPKGLLRAALSEVIPTKLTDTDDPTVASAIGKHLGREVVERLVDPLLGGINASDSNRLSLAMAAPNLMEAVKQPYFMRALRKSNAAAQRGAIGSETNAAEKPVFLTPRTGINTMIQRLADCLGSAVVAGQTATSLSRSTGGSWMVTTALNEWHTGQVVLASPAAATATLVADLSSRAADLLGQIRTSSVAIALLAYPKDAVNLPPGSGILVPRSEGKMLTASSWWNQKWPHLDTKGQVLMRASAGRDGDVRFMELTDAQLVERLHRELSEMLPISAPPSDAHVQRWIGAFPQYDTGHARRVDSIEAAIAADAPGLHLTGASYRGIGIPACIRSAKATALKVVGSLAAPETPASVSA